MRIPVRISEIRQESPTVKSFKFDLNGQEFMFLPGQWLDCYLEIDGKTEVGGYSMTSSPTVTDSFELAIKLIGDHPVTNYLHERAKVGDTVYVEGGQGDFFYQPNMGKSLVLIAGGIGITPIMSIVRYADLAVPDASVKLFYSAQNPSELLFHQELTEMAERNGNFSCHYTVTQYTGESWDNRRGRINAKMLADSQADLNALFYICGPPAMIQDMVNMVQSLGVPEPRIHYEQWW